jgi:hypothetical protein
MRIEVLNVAKTTRPGSKPGSSFGQLDVAYKNLDDGKVSAKKVMSFGDWKNAYEVLQSANANEQFTVKNEKKGDFWVWTEVSKGVAEGATNTNNNKTAQAAPKSTYETPEERARRQVLIVRQSSLSAAVDTLKTEKAAADGEAVVKLAEYYVDFVFQQGMFGGVKAVDAKPSTDFEDDIPY